MPHEDAESARDEPRTDESSTRYSSYLIKRFCMLLIQRHSSRLSLRKHTQILYPFRLALSNPAKCFNLPWLKVEDHSDRHLPASLMPYELRRSQYRKACQSDLMHWSLNVASKCKARKRFEHITEGFSHSTPEKSCRHSCPRG